MGKPVNKAKLREIEIIDIQDAKVPFKYILTRDHVWGSRSRDKRLYKNLQEFAVTKCIQMNSVNSMPGVLESHFFKTIAYVRFINNPHIAWRYTPSQDGKHIARMNDDAKQGKKKLLELLKKPIELWLEVPRWNRSLECSRSEEMRNLRRESKERNAGGPTRSYDSPERGFRNGSGIGKAHMWYHQLGR